MTTVRIALIALLAIPQLAPARQSIFEKPLSPRIANYDIKVTLDDKEKTLHGKQTLIWRNTSRDFVRELQFHLYLNAFKNSESTFMKESSGRIRGSSMSGSGWGWIDIDSMAVRNGEVLTEKIRFIHPDDDNELDRTVISVPLSRPVRPNQTITVDIIFTAKLPRVLARTGYEGDFFMVGQWFPKIGVYEPAGMRSAGRGRWNCHQFHATGEFYADYGTYDVSITLPKQYIVGATGSLQSQSRDSLQTTHVYRAEDVHDFAWTASSRYVVVDDQWEHVALRLLIQPEHRQFTDQYLQSVKASLQYFHDWVGPYPYPNFTIVDPPLRAFKAGGMEYPTLITGEAVWGMPDGIRFTEMVTVHEFAHQYWYGLVGSNEFEEAWLDEGITQYSEVRIMDDTYGHAVDILGIRIKDLELSRSGYLNMDNPSIAPTKLNAWEYKAGGYGSLTYSKPALFLTTLERMIGRDVMDEIMRTYFERWRFRHPSSGDFIAVVNEVVRKRHGRTFGPDMNWFFDQVLYGTEQCDYELTSISSIRTQIPGGIFDDEEHATRVTAAKYESRVLVNRLGDMVMPVDVLVVFEDGTEYRERWDGRARWKEFRFETNSRILRATIDPDHVLLLDRNLLNNSKTTDPSRSPARKYTARFLFWVQNILHHLSLF